TRSGREHAHRTGATAREGVLMRVLIADDDADVRELLVEVFRDAGFDVLEASNGLEALLYVKRDRPDAVVLDLMMPRLGGVEALKRIHAFNPGIRVLVVTGAIDPELHRQATAAGAAGVFTKPVNATALVAALTGPPPPAPPSALTTTSASRSRCRTSRGPSRQPWRCGGSRRARNAPPDPLNSAGSRHARLSLAIAAVTLAAQNGVLMSFAVLYLPLVAEFG